MDLATAKALLQRHEGGPNGESLYDHLTDVLLKIITEQPSAGLAQFEQISCAVKAVRGPRAAAAAAGAPYPDAGRARLAAEDALFRTPADGEEPPPSAGAVQDLVGDAALLEWGGVSLGRTQTYKLSLALRKLAVTQGALNVRLWGKLQGLAGDYFVAESDADAGGAEEPGLDALGNTIHPVGDGPNKHAYWVCTAPGEPWVQLPHVTPHQVVAARALRRYLTGSLSAPVAGHPPFPGTEANYVRAVIALISAATVLAPTGAFASVDAESEDASVSRAIAPAEEWEPEDLRNLSAWVHTHLDLNALGRTAPNPAKADATEDAFAAEEEAPPPPSEPLKPATDDALTRPEMDEGGGAWDIRVVPSLPSGVNDTSAPVGSPSGPAAAVLRSLHYPGAVTVGAGKKWASVYVGFGHPSALEPFAPQLPALPPTEWDFSEEGKALKEEPDVTEDPDAGKVVEGEEGEGAEATE